MELVTKIVLYIQNHLTVMSPGFMLKISHNLYYCLHSDTQREFFIFSQGTLIFSGTFRAKNCGGAANNDDSGFLCHHGMIFMHLVQNSFL